MGTETPSVGSPAMSSFSLAQARSERTALTLRAIVRLARPRRAESSATNARRCERVISVSREIFCPSIQEEN